MKISIPLASLALAGALGLAGCSGSKWQTNYADVIDPAVAKGWRVVAVDVTVPRSLTVSEANSFAPNADIVWREYPYTDRYEQVDAIITAAAKRGAADLQGKRKVKLLITVQQFHALSEKARAVLQNSGVHDITFTAQVVDAATNTPVSPPDLIKADLVAFVGDQAVAAEKQGLTQKVRITDHVAAVIAGWLGTGDDMRGSFNRNGR
ncbi:DUF6778 family protein [Profundibacter sp.]